MARPMDGIVPGAESSLRAHLIEAEACWFEIRCAGCGGSTTMPVRLLIRRYGPDIEVGAYVSRLKCKRCGIPPADVRLKERPNDVASQGSTPGWSVQLIDRPAVSVSGRNHSQEPARPG